MAAGLGTRLAPFTTLLPKPLVPLMGIPLIQFHLDQLAAAGVKEVVINFHHLPDLARQSYLALDSKGLRVHVSDESAELLGSAGGIRKVLRFFSGEPFYLLNADTLSFFGLNQLSEHFFQVEKKASVEMVLSLQDGSKIPGKYKEILHQPDTMQLQGTGPVAQGKWFYGGAAAFSPKAFEHLTEGRPQDFFKDVFQKSLTSGLAYGYLQREAWLDTGSPEEWHHAHLGLMEQMERDAVPDFWKRRLMSGNQRLGPMQWLIRDGFTQGAHDTSRWKAPCYWGGPGIPPEELGPGAVCYGRPSPYQEMKNGISFGGYWSPCLKFPDAHGSLKS